MLTALFVAVRIIANPVSNVFQKQLTQRSANPIFIIGATHGLLTLATLPMLFGPVKLAHGGSIENLLEENSEAVVIASPGIGFYVPHPHDVAFDFQPSTASFEFRFK